MPAPEANEFADQSSAERSDDNSFLGFSIKSSRTHNSVGENETTTTPRNTKFKSPKCEQLGFSAGRPLTCHSFRHAAALAASQLLRDAGLAEQ